MVNFCLRVFCLLSCLLINITHATTYLITDKIIFDARYTLEYQDGNLLLTDTIGEDHQTIHINSNGPLEKNYAHGEDSMPLAINFNPKGFLLATQAQLSLSNGSMGIQYLKRYGWGYGDRGVLRFGGHGFIGMAFGIKKEEYLVVDQMLSIKLFLAKDIYIFAGTPAAETLREGRYQSLTVANISTSTSLPSISTPAAQAELARQKAERAQREYEAAQRENARRELLEKEHQAARKRQEQQIDFTVNSKIKVLYPNIDPDRDLAKCFITSSISRTGHVTYNVTLIRYGADRNLDFCNPTMKLGQHTFEFDLDPNWHEETKASISTREKYVDAEEKLLSEKEEVYVDALEELSAATSASSSSQISAPTIPAEKNPNAFTLSEYFTDETHLLTEIEHAAFSKNYPSLGEIKKWRAIFHQGRTAGLIIDSIKDPRSFLPSGIHIGSAVIGNGSGNYRTILIQKGYSITERESDLEGFFGSTRIEPFYFCHKATHTCSLLE